MQEKNAGVCRCFPLPAGTRRVNQKARAGRMVPPGPWDRRRTELLRGEAALVTLVDGPADGGPGLDVFYLGIVRVGQVRAARRALVAATGDQREAEGETNGREHGT